MNNEYRITKDSLSNRQIVKLSNRQISSSPLLKKNFMSLTFSFSWVKD